MLLTGAGTLAELARQPVVLSTRLAAWIAASGAAAPSESDG